MKQTLLNPNPKIHIQKVTLILLLVLAATVTYINSFNGVFLFDDFENIIDNTKIHSLTNPWNFLQDTRRPLLYFTLAGNYAISAVNPWSYHFINFVIHVTAGLTLFAVLNRIFAILKLEKYTTLAFSVTLLWLVHPLLTESVTYIIQRAESMAGLFYLLTIYGALRYWQNLQSVWAYFVGFMACAGILTKETVVTAPLIILLFDRAFISGSFRISLTKHVRLYLSLMVSWVIMIWLFLSVDLALRPSEQMAERGPTWLEYLRVQPQVIIHYLKLTVYPHPLIFDYRWPFTYHLASAIIPTALLLIILLSAIWFYIKKNCLGFGILTFFILLAPSSGIIPLMDAAFEHRMYLPLVAVLGIGVVGIWRGLLILKLWSNEVRRYILILIIMMGTFVFGVLTIQRNYVYHSEIQMWQDVINKQPVNERAYNILGNAYLKSNQKLKAVKAYQSAIALSPNYLAAYCNLGNTWFDLGHAEFAIDAYQRALELDPSNITAGNNLADTYHSIGLIDKAKTTFIRTINANPHYAPAYYNLGLIYEEEGNLKAAKIAFEKARQLDPQLRY